MHSLAVSTNWNEKQERLALLEAGQRLGLSEAETPGLDGKEYVKFGFCGYLILVDPLELPEWCLIALIVNVDGPHRPNPLGVRKALRYVSRAFNAPIKVEARSASRKRLYTRYGASPGEGHIMYWSF